MAFFKKVKVGIRGDMIEVKLFDNNYRQYYKGTAQIGNLKEMRQLIDDLRDKGVTFSSSWFD